MAQQDVPDALGGLPEDSRHRALLAADTLREAVWDYLVNMREPWKVPPHPPVKNQAADGAFRSWDRTCREPGRGKSLSLWLLGSRPGVSSG